MSQNPISPSQIGYEPATAVPVFDIVLNTGQTFFTKTNTGNNTFTFSNVPASPASFIFNLELTFTSGSIAFPASVKWPSGVTPVLATGKIHLLSFYTRNGGANWFGSVLTDYTV